MVNEIAPYEIRWASPQEWEDVMTFVWKAFLQSEGKKCTEEGRKSFYRFIADRELRESFYKGEYPIVLATVRNAIAGVAAIRYHNHLSLLFVDADYYRQGIGRALMTAAIQYVRDNGERYMSLQATSDAVNFYRRLGFRSIRPEEEFTGIRITRMERFF